jgi:hypothetical protein
MTRNRIDGEPLRWARTARDAWPWMCAENAHGIDGPPEPYITGWRALWRDVLSYLRAPTFTQRDHALDRERH